MRLRPGKSDNRNALLRLMSKLASPRRAAITVFTGAGASRPFGYPLTRDLMLSIFRNLSFKRLSARRKVLKAFLKRLLPGDRGAVERVPLVTSVLSLLDHSIATGQALLPETPIEQMREMRSLLDYELLMTIPDFEEFSEKEAERFHQYVTVLSTLRRASSPHPLGLITTNYDMIADVAAFSASRIPGDLGNWDFKSIARRIDFGFEWADPFENVTHGRPRKPLMTLLKLHGSTNWLRCPLCENLYLNPNGPISTLAGSSFSWYGNTCHCSDTHLEPQIVSPSFLRSLKDANVIATWRCALATLRNSRQWLIIGYGLPDEDVAIRALFTRALNPATRVTVLQWDQSARTNYQSFFPTDRFEYIEGGLELLLDVAGG